MRKILGGLVLAAGVGGLGWHATSTNAVRMEQAVASGARDVAALAVHGVTATVSGRDIAAAGLAADQAEFAQLEAAFQAVEGRRIVDMAAVSVLPLADPFALTVARDAQGQVTGLRGVVGSEADREAIAAAINAPADDLVLSAGRPDAAWAGVVASGFAGLSVLQSGEMTLSGQTLSISGQAVFPDDRAAALGAIGALPEGYVLEDRIEILDDGLPLRIDLALRDGAVSGAGKLPQGLAQDDVAGRFAATGALAFSAAQAALADENWPAFAAAGLEALALLETGDLAIIDRTLTLTGTAAPEAQAAAQALLAVVPDGYAATVDITLTDDGLPPVWSLDYDAATGATLAGKLPDGIGVDAIRAALQLSRIGGEPVAGRDAPYEGTAIDVLAVTADYLPEIEAFSYRSDNGAQAIDLVLSPGVNIDLVAADLAQRLPADVQFAAQALAVLPRDGAIRTNQATARRERFQFGNWLPILTFAPVLTICNDQSVAALGGSLGGAGINFLSGSAQLDAKSIRSINALAAVAQRCIDEGGLSLEVGGHTDNTGDAAQNQILSEDRADAVRSALIARGVDVGLSAAVGYGSSQPIADNATESGRAQNRRTVFIWSE